MHMYRLLIKPSLRCHIIWHSSCVYGQNITKQCGLFSEEMNNFIVITVHQEQRRVLLF
jgi:hypothetical protein